MPRPRASDFFANWRDWDGPLGEKIRLSVRNNARKVRTGSDCCGNHGQPGC